MGAINCSSEAPTVEKRFAYDTFGRNHQVTEIMPTGTFVSRTEFDSLGRASVVHYPQDGSGIHLSLRNQYNDYGFLEQVEDADTAQIYQRIHDMNRRGQMVSMTQGDVISTEYLYTDDGLLSDVMVDRGAAFNVHTLQYEYDRLNNIDLRIYDYSNNTSSVDDKIRAGLMSYNRYQYDDLNRMNAHEFKALSSSNTVVDTLHDYRYDALGNLESKHDIASYRYNNESNPYQLTAIHGINDSGNFSLEYDASGNVLGDGRRTFLYTSFDKVRRIQKDQTVTTFHYGPERSRWRRMDTRIEDGGTNHYDTTYIGKAYEKIVRTGAKGDLIEYKFFIPGGIVTKRDNGAADEVHYLHLDHQGSTLAVTNTQGEVLQRNDYTPFGEQIRLAATGPLTNIITNRLYTGHEQVDGLDIIHMNGRIYDARWGRFLQADPFVQTPTDSQSYNRYAYVRNNPLNYTDPSGYFLVGLIKGVRNFVKKYWRQIAAIAIAVYLPGALKFSSEFWATTVAGFVSGAVSSGSLKGAVTGAFTAVVFHGVDNQFAGEAHKIWKRRSSSQNFSACSHGRSHVSIARR